MSENGAPSPPDSQASRIFSILEACASAGRALTLPELAAAAGLPKSSLHRACSALVELGGLVAHSGWVANLAVPSRHNALLVEGVFGDRGPRDRAPLRPRGVARVAALLHPVKNVNVRLG